MTRSGLSMMDVPKAMVRATHDILEDETPENVSPGTLQPKVRRPPQHFHDAYTGRGVACRRANDARRRHLRLV
ncbi:MAG: hypothetical protein JWN34_3713 [Bryobacterales bacterium]|nr:hypothetical protein [Bryobacterales bacterium]